MIFCSMIQFINTYNVVNIELIAKWFVTHSLKLESQIPKQIKTDKNLFFDRSLAICGHNVISITTVRLPRKIHISYSIRQMEET